jgi:hypothetical protein
MVARNFDVEIAAAEAKVLDAEAALKAKVSDPVYSAKLAELTAQHEAATKRREEASKSLEARRLEVLIKKQIVVQADNGIVHNNPVLVEALLAEAGITIEEATCMKSPHSVSPFRISDHSRTTPIDMMIQKMIMDAVALDAEYGRYLKERNEADHEQTRIGNTLWHHQGDARNLADSVEWAKRELAKIKGDKESARIDAEYRAEQRAKAKVPDPSAVERKAREARLAKGKKTLLDIYNGQREFVWPKGVPITPDEKLAKLRAEWERGYAVEGVVKTEDGSVLVSLSKTGGYGIAYEFALHRYFLLGGEWKVSVDYKGNERDESRM